MSILVEIFDNSILVEIFEMSMSILVEILEKLDFGRNFQKISLLVEIF